MAKSSLASMKAKAAIALAFLGGINQCCTSAIGDDKVQQALRTIKKPDSKSTSPQSPQQRYQYAELRAYRLLSRADGYLRNDDRAKVEASFPIESDAPVNFRFRLDDALAGWAERLARDNTSQAQPPKNAAVAIETVNKALIELKSASDQNAKLNMYFISSMFLQRAGDKKHFKIAMASSKNSFALVKKVSWSMNGRYRLRCQS